MHSRLQKSLMIPAGVAALALGATGVASAAQHSRSAEFQRQPAQWSPDGGAPNDVFARDTAATRNQQARRDDQARRDEQARNDERARRDDQARNDERARRDEDNRARDAAFHEFPHGVIMRSDDNGSGRVLHVQAEDGRLFLIFVDFDGRITNMEQER
jgi:hypothetical protein